ncbi:MAG TPA: ATP-binding cassette domain-containing protein [Syntrophales bacterium]|nr:ATP-binding cassette domain-containing protein [Syntrophales bacterium]HOL58841.1 ATP-binding cassette domain-containing protein [Syntrophales bacterium]HPO35168.1 ATP-binding cassette domain-containing protein [Syntrophales bacterium]
MTKVVEAQGLSRSFGRIRAVQDFTVTIEREEIFGLLGPNGAGKTTTINMLITILPPTAGRASIAGFDIVRDARKVRSCVGIVFQDPTLDTVLTGRENLELHARLYGMKRPKYTKRIEELLELVNLHNRADDLVRTYSGGMRRRLELVRGLLHQPAVLFLDEPTLGLDPQTRARTWEYIRLMAKKEGTTVLLTTHYLEEAQQMCDRIAIMDEGKIMALDTPARLIDALGGIILVIEAPSLPEAELKELPFVKSINGGNGRWEIMLKDTYENLPYVIEKVKPINHLEIRRPSLNDVFLKLTGRRIRDDAMEDAGGWLEAAFRHEQRGR